MAVHSRAWSCISLHSCTTMHGYLRLCMAMYRLDCEQSLFFFNARNEGGSPRRKKCLFRLAPSVTRMVLCLGRFARRTKKKERLLVVYVPLCTAMNDYIRLFSNDNLRLYTTMHGYIRLCTAIRGIYGYVRLCRAMYCYVRLYMAKYGHLRLCTGMYGNAWLCEVMEGYVRLFTAM